MKERVERSWAAVKPVTFTSGTFHSVFCPPPTQRTLTELGYPNDFTIYDSDDAKSVLKTIMNELNLDDKHYKPNLVYNRISAAKNSLMGPGGIPA